jgi:EPS-associated MarR family transcriptional regulator
MSPDEQAHFRLLKLLETNPDLTQRELAEQTGLSLGRTNFLLHAFLEKGWIKVGNFRKSDKKLNKIAYMLTRSGIGHRVQLTQAYLERKKAEYLALQLEIEALERESSSTDKEVRNEPPRRQRSDKT